MSVITTIEELEALYGEPAEASIIKEVGRVTPEYRAWIEASPFVALATSGRVNGRAHLSPERARQSLW